MATSSRWRACASACVPMDHTISVNARPRPAMTPSAIERVRARTRSTVTAAATATHSAASRFIRRAGSPNGVRTRLASQASRT